MTEQTADTAVPLKQYADSLAADCPFFTRPVQRQRWEDTQIHPVVNWGDLFFDLLYVAAAYNLSIIIVESPTSKGLLYFVGCFWAVLYMWLDKMYFDSRFFTHDDIWHRIFEVAVLIVVATAVVHIRPIEFLSAPSEHPDMFIFCLVCVLANLLTIARYVEVYFCVVGELAAKKTALRDIFAKLLPTVFYVAATVVAGVEYYGSSSGDVKAGGARDLAAATDPYTTSSSYSTSSTNVPIWLLCGAQVVTIVWMTLLITLLYPSGGRHKEISVPMNIDYVIHRNGEWTMLMLGESILSLLIVDVPNGTEYYLTFYAGLLSVIILQYVHFLSAPAHADEHAMRRRKEAGWAFTVLMQIYSAALILLGVSYKMFLYEYTYEDAHRMLLETVPRLLAGGSAAVQFDEAERKQYVANFFSGSLAAVWLCSDLMILVHKGLYDNLGRCRCENTHRVKFIGVVLVLCRAGLIVFIATLSVYETDPLPLALIGLAGIVAQVILRGISSVVFPDDRVHIEKDEHGDDIEVADDPDEKKWPNMTEAQAIPAKADALDIEVAYDQHEKKCPKTTQAQAMPAKEDAVETSSDSGSQEISGSQD